MPLTIGKLAKRAGVTIETIRYYQRKGLLREPEKPFNGYRQYPCDAIIRIRFIKRAQQSGFTLKEIAELLTFDRGHCDDVRKIAEQKRQQIVQQINDLRALQNVLDSLIESCQLELSLDQCSMRFSIFRFWPIAALLKQLHRLTMRLFQRLALDQNQVAIKSATVAVRSIHVKN